MNVRMERVDNLVKKELGLLLAEYAQELYGLLTITFVKTSPDLAQSIIGISCYGTQLEPTKIIEKLNLNRHSIHQQLKPRIKLKKVPKLEFRLDESAEKVDRLEHLFIQIKKDLD